MLFQRISVINLLSKQIAMKDIVEPNQHKLAAKMLREIADQQPFHVEIYHEAFPFADQYLIILPSTIKNVLISLMVMTIIAFLLIPSCSSGSFGSNFWNSKYFSSLISRDHHSLNHFHLHGCIRIHDILVCFSHPITCLKLNKHFTYFRGVNLDAVIFFQS